MDGNSTSWTVSSYSSRVPVATHQRAQLIRWTIRLRFQGDNLIFTKHWETYYSDHSLLCCSLNSISDNPHTASKWRGVYDFQGFFTLFKLCHTPSALRWAMSTITTNTNYTGCPSATHFIIEFIYFCSLHSYTQMLIYKWYKIYFWSTPDTFRVQHTMPGPQAVAADIMMPVLLSSIHAAIYLYHHTISFPPGLKKY